MVYKLFLDDERMPVTDDWVICRTSTAAIECVIKRGMPYEISFDHDLGGPDTSMIFVRWMQDALLDGIITMPENFMYGIHSQNSVGAPNIKGAMDPLIRHFKQ